MASLRVGYLTGEFPRPTDTWIQREIAALRHEGFIIDTFSVRRPDTEIVSESQADHAGRTTYLFDSVKSLALVVAHAKLALRGPSAYLKTMALAWRTKRPGIKGGGYQLAYWAEAGLLAAHLRRRQVQHLHNHLGDSSCTVAMLAAPLAGIGYSFTLHGPGIFWEPYTWRIDEKIARARFVACISYFCRSQAAVFAPEHMDKLQIVHCGVTEIVEPDSPPPLATGQSHQRLLFVARLAELKGVRDLLHAVAGLRNEFPEISLTIAGDGPSRSRFEALTQQLGLDDVVTFTGYVSPQTVTNELAAADVLVLPSYAEGVPVTLMEAMALGRPVVATQVGGVSELVEDEVNGLIVRPGDVDGLARALGRLLSDPQLGHNLGRNGAEKVRREFNTWVEARRLGQLFLDAVTD